MNKWQAAALLWLAASVYALLLHPGGNTPPPFAHFDKAVHAGLFFGQFWLWAKAYFSCGRAIPYRLLTACALLWAAGSEVLQAVFTPRHGDPWDAAADMAGALAALWLIRRVSQARTQTTTATQETHHEI